MRWPWQRRRVVIVPQQPEARQEPLTDSEVDAVRAWSLQGVPTSAAITLALIETLYESRDDLDPRVPRYP